MHPLNPHHLERIESRFADPQPGSLAPDGEQRSQWARPASVTEFRAGFESEKQLQEKFWQTVKDVAAARRERFTAEHLDRMHQADAQSELRQTNREAERAVTRPIPA